jgi:hypothetical protein
MRCKQCEYALWNLPAGKCPECGEPFKPSDFEFIVGAVQFCCPDCAQVYYGDGELGHLRPRAFDCVTCGRAVDMDEMLLLPAAGVSDAETMPEPAPWVRRREIGRFRAYRRTLGWTLVTPSRVVQHLPEQGGALDALLFAFITSMIVTVAGVGLMAALIVLPMLASQQGGGPPLSLLMFTPITLGLIAPLISVGAVALWGLITHGFLRLTGGCAGPLSRTLRAMYYGQGPVILKIIPSCGGTIAFFWTLVSTTNMVRTDQQVGGWRATIAVAGPPLVMVALVIAAIVSLFVGIARAATGPAMPMGVPAPPITAPLPSQPAAVAMAAALAPEHVLDLYVRGTVTGSDLRSMQDDASLPVAEGMTLDEVLGLPPDEIEALVDRLVAARPAGQPWYYFADVLYCYSGLGDVDLTGEPATIIAYRVVLHPMGYEYGEVYFHDGTGSSFAGMGHLQDAIDEDNARRAGLGLPSVPSVGEYRGARRRQSRGVADG